MDRLCRPDPAQKQKSKIGLPPSSSRSSSMPPPTTFSAGKLACLHLAQPRSTKTGQDPGAHASPARQRLPGSCPNQKSSRLCNGLNPRNGSNELMRGRRNSLAVAFFLGAGRDLSSACVHGAKKSGYGCVLTMDWTCVPSLEENLRSFRTSRLKKPPSPCWNRGLFSEKLSDRGQSAKIGGKLLLLGWKEEEEREEAAWHWRTCILTV